MASRRRVALAATDPKPMTIEAVRIKSATRFKRTTPSEHAGELVQARIEALEAGEPNQSPVRRPIRVVPEGKPFRRIG